MPDSWSSDVCEVEWHKGGANNSKGCLKIFNPVFDNPRSNGPENPQQGYLEAEKYISWSADGTYIDFDYYAEGISNNFYALGWSNNNGFRCESKGAWVKGKWAHAQVKGNDFKKEGEETKSASFRNLVLVFLGVDKGAKDAYVLVDNILITATKKQ